MGREGQASWALQPRPSTVMRACWVVLAFCINSTRGQPQRRCYPHLRSDYVSTNANHVSINAGHGNLAVRVALTNRNSVGYQTSRQPRIVRVLDSKRAASITAKHLRSELGLLSGDFIGSQLAICCFDVRGSGHHRFARLNARAAP